MATYDAIYVKEIEERWFGSKVDHEARRVRVLDDLRYLLDLAQATGRDLAQRRGLAEMVNLDERVLNKPSDFVVPQYRTVAADLPVTPGDTGMDVEVEDE